MMQEKAIDLSAYWDVLRKWWWILALGVLIASGGAYIVSKATSPTYVAAVKLLVQGGQTPGSPSLSEIEVSQRLALNYGDLIKTRRVMEQVIEQLSLPYGPGSLSAKITARSPRSLIEIRVVDLNPQMAAQIANTTAEVFIDDLLNRQIAQIAQFQSVMSQYGISEDSAVITAQATALSMLSVVEEALPPSTPSSPRTKLNVLAASVIGLLVASMLIFLLEYVDNTLKSPDELAVITGIHNLGAVPYFPPNDSLSPSISEGKQSNTSLTEAFRFVRSNLEFATLDSKGFSRLLITSSIPGEGKTMTAANIAKSMAQEGVSVILVDTDLRKPAQHRMFGVENRMGLTQLLLGSATLEEVLIQTQIENLQLLTSGPLPPDPPRILRSDRMKEIIEQLDNAVEYVIYDSSPLLSVTDPMLVARLVDGVVFVADARGTSRNLVQRGFEALRQADVNVIGTILNKIPSKEHDYYYYSDDEIDRSRNGRFGFLSNISMKPNPLFRTQVAAKGFAKRLFSRIKGR
jgi:capsular exopolysaccharide synthesis family protein